MKFALVYDKNDQKLRPQTYSPVFRNMFEALKQSRFDVTDINNDCSAQDIDADVILFYDVHSCHHIKIDGIEKHSALKLEYYSDPHQKEVKGQYQDTGAFVHKLGAKQRIDRSLNRGIDHIISPVKERFFTYFESYLNGNCEKMLWYFPLTPNFTPGTGLIVNRIQEVLGNGATWDGGIGAYEFRKWAFEQPYIHHIPHWIQNKKVPCGNDYSIMLKMFAGGLALSEFYPVPKYFEMPLAGMVTFIQHHQEYEDLGFKNYENCVYVNKNNFEWEVGCFLNDMKKEQFDRWQEIADAGRDLVANNYTSKYFANWLYNKCLSERGE